MAKNHKFIRITCRNVVSVNVVSELRRDKDFFFWNRFKIFYAKMFFVSRSKISSSDFFFKYITLLVKKMPIPINAPNMVSNAVKNRFILQPPSYSTYDTLLLYHNGIKREKMKHDSSAKNNSGNAGSDFTFYV